MRTVSNFAGNSIATTGIANNLLCSIIISDTSDSDMEALKTNLQSATLTTVFR
jgi:hypothetical protein